MYYIYLCLVVGGFDSSGVRGNLFLVLQFDHCQFPLLLHLSQSLFIYIYIYIYRERRFSELHNYAVKLLYVGRIEHPDIN